MAVERGATIVAEVLGSASTADAHHITAPCAGEDRVRCGPWSSPWTTPASPRPTWPVDQRARHVHTAQRRGRSRGRGSKVFGSARAAHDLHQGRDRAPAGRRRRHRGGSGRAVHAAPAHPAHPRVSPRPIPRCPRSTWSPANPRHGPQAPRCPTASGSAATTARLFLARVRIRKRMLMRAAQAPSVLAGKAGPGLLNLSPSA